MELTLIIITSLVLLSQFLIDFIVETKKRQVQIGVSILILGLISIWLAYIVQVKDKEESKKDHSEEIKEQKKNFQKLDSTYKVLETELRIRNSDLAKIKTQNDSLNNTLRQLREKQEQTLEFSKYSAHEVNKSRVAIENMGFKQVSRGISDIDKIDMVRFLSINKGSSVTITAVMGDAESLQFAYQIQDVFKQAGWKVDGINQAMYTNVVKGIYLLVKSENYPTRVNSIFESFKVIGMVAKGEINNNLGDNDVEIVIGTK